jgi:hypothetical protein
MSSYSLSLQCSRPSKVPALCKNVFSTSRKTSRQASWQCFFVTPGTFLAHGPTKQYKVSTRRRGLVAGRGTVCVEGELAFSEQTVSAILCPDEPANNIFCSLECYGMLFNADSDVYLAVKDAAKRE